VERLGPDLVGVASRAGLLQNDMIVSINGKPAAEWPGKAISLFFTSLTADDIELLIVRGGKKREIRIPGG
jgi:S1-C subfamily serine protease